MSGFVAMERGALDHPLLKDAERFRAWFWIVSKACWKPTPYDVNGKIISLNRGQLCASRSQLAEAWGWSPSAVERFLTRLETEQMIGRATGQGRTIITVCNYGKYQDVEEKTGQATGQDTGQRPDSDRTAKEQRNQETKDIPSPNGDGRAEVAPLCSDLAASIFRTGLVILGEAGHAEQSARRVIGKWRKSYSTGSVIAVLASCQNQNPRPSDPIAWVEAALQAEQLRAAGQVAYAQPAREERASVSEVGAEIVAELAERRGRTLQPQHSHQERLAISGR